MPLTAEDQAKMEAELDKFAQDLQPIANKYPEALIAIGQCIEKHKMASYTRICRTIIGFA